MSPKTVRQEVLAYLERRKAASAAQIGVALNKSAATVRHHLGILVKDGRVVAEGQVAKRKRGRPEKNYRLSDRVRGDNFEMLAEAAMTIWLEMFPAEEQDAAIQELARKLISQLAPIDSSISGAKRVVQLTAKLSALHYEAGWEAGAQGPRVMLGHCPYAAVIARHPELCQMDTDILGTQMNGQAEQISKIGQGPGGPSHCVFAIRVGAKPGAQH